METRFLMEKVNPEGYKGMLELEKAQASSGIDPTLKELIKIRASQLNGCAFCLNMHTKDARQNGETEQRIYALNAWREAPFFTEKERAVLELTEAVTRIGEHGLPDEVHNEVRTHFSEAETAELIMAVVTINAWNRIAIATRKMPAAD
ncbi:carboxymuconolactone decarboxylase family protein [Bacillus haynesii]|uniref:carboxymuconolactone decarboxylase family protein n=1 Tax=Bacillus haynesii TaxID=1925021 RepID=UPI00227E5BC1|nr:carboxymuconolactone decarboxylase family protein [Bacillus haynesii]MCY7769461.1 carboxymuconolactone decarboxylase family protein [Bacillus haynesii]MCY8004490.1 carboxymuconolactone decarboxylase family protein [Bacillus haynesii]MCY9214941.1 carboxymuconolactone decarboxylase family protein [Bacillus haynesii]MCY9223455.1 carboxymuconolactone decarboxylase family protein [Bacillus haynesii]MEC0752578.1 carboxymuconolactone decarboxylase family protein [Bacillus haynesii]